MRISDWRSDVCSSDLQRGDLGGQLAKGLGAVVGATHQAELVLHERVADFDDFHAAKSSAWVGATPPTAAKSKTVGGVRSEEHTSELQSLMRISYAVFCLKKKKTNHN